MAESTPETTSVAAGSEPSSYYGTPISEGWVNNPVLGVCTVEAAKSAEANGAIVRIRHRDGWSWAITSETAYYETPADGKKVGDPYTKASQNYLDWDALYRRGVIKDIDAKEKAVREAFAS